MGYLDKAGLSRAFTKLKTLIDKKADSARMDPVVTSGTGAAYTATVPWITSLSIGASFLMQPHVLSTSTSPTLNVNGLGAKTIRVQLSNSSATAVAPAQQNFLGTNKPVKVMYNGNFWVAQLIRPDSSGIYGQVKIENGGTGADTAAKARQNLGIATANGTTISTNADYAEVGEWADGNTNDEDRIGYFVAIDNSSAGATMVKAKPTSDVRGVTVATPAFSGNCSDDKFDESGELLKQYDYVAVMGMVSVIDNGTCIVNGRCMPTNDGTAVPSTNDMGYQVIDRIDSTHVLVAVEPQGDMVARIREAIEGLQNNKVPTSRTINGKALSSNITLSASNVGAAASSHTHNYAGSSSAGGNANWANGATYANYSYNDKPITTGGTGSAYTASVSGLTLVAGASFVMVPNVVSATTAPTLNVNSLGAKTIRMRISSSTSATVALPSASFLAASKPVRMVYDGTYWIIDDLVMPDANNTYGTLISRGTAAPTSSTAGYIYIQTT